LSGIKINNNYILRGRNVGQATTFSLGAFYAFYVKHNSKNSSLLNNQ